MSIRGIGGSHDLSYAPPLPPRGPSHNSAPGHVASTSGLASRGVPHGAPLPRAATPRATLPSPPPQREKPAGFSQRAPLIAGAIAQRVGHELAAFVPDRMLSAFRFSGYLAHRPPLKQTLDDASSLQDRLAGMRGGNPKMDEPKGTAVFKDVRKTWGHLRQTPVGELLANREAVKQQMPQLQAEVEQTYKQAAAAYAPPHPVWNEAAKALVMTQVSTCHVYARMAAVNVLGLHKMVGAPAPASRAPTQGNRA